MTSIVIFGSCVTRDALNNLPSRHSIVFYDARCSIASIISEPINVDVPSSSNVNEFERRCIERDLNKTFFTRLKIAQPDVLVIDFIDERYDLCKLDGQYFSWNPMGTRIMEIEELYRTSKRIRKNSEEGKLVWRSALPQFVEALWANIPNITVILVDARFGLQFRTREGNIAEQKREILYWCTEANSMLEFMVSNFLKIVPDCKLVKAPRELELADASHRWGFQPFHYIEEWYDFVRNEIFASIDLS